MLGNLKSLVQAYTIVLALFSTVIADTLSTIQVTESQAKTDPLLCMQYIAAEISDEDTRSLVHMNSSRLCAGRYLDEKAIALAEASGDYDVLDLCISLMLPHADSASRIELIINREAPQKEGFDRNTRLIRAAGKAVELHRPDLAWQAVHLISDSSYRSIAFEEMAEAGLQQDSLQTSLEYFEEACLEEEKLNQPKSIASTMLDAARLLIDAGHHAVAMSYVHEAYSRRHHLDDCDDSALVLGMTATRYMNLGCFDSIPGIIAQLTTLEKYSSQKLKWIAESYISKDSVEAARRVAELIEDPDYKISAFELIAEYSLANADTATASEIYDMQLEVVDLLERRVTREWWATNIADNLLTIGRKKQGLSILASAVSAFGADEYDGAYDSMMFHPRDIYLKDLGKIYIKHRYFEEAHQIYEVLKGSFYKILYLESMAHGYAEAGDTASAYEVLNFIEDEDRKSFQICDFACAVGDDETIAGIIEDSLYEDAPTRRRNVLVRIAGYMIERDQQSALSQVLDEAVALTLSIPVSESNMFMLDRLTNMLLATGDSSAAFDLLDEANPMFADSLPTPDYYPDLGPNVTEEWARKNLMSGRYSEAFMFADKAPKAEHKIRLLVDIAEKLHSEGRHDQFVEYVALLHDRDDRLCILAAMAGMCYIDPIEPEDRQLQFLRELVALSESQ